MSGAGLIRDARNGPLCPQSDPYARHPAHELRVRLGNARYAAQEPLRDADNELPADLDAIEGKILEATSERMRLYHAADSGMVHGRYVAVEAFYWRCLICGFVLPATALRLTPTTTAT